MSKVLVLYYSSYGHIEQMAQAIAEGARSAGAQVDIKRVPETVPEAIAKSAHFKMDQKAPVAEVAELADYDAIIVGTGTRFGRMSSQIIGRNPFNADRFRKVLDHVPDNLLRQGFLEVSQRFPLLPSTPSGCVQLDRRRDLRLDRVAGVAAR